MNLLINRNPLAEFDHLFRAMERDLESVWRGATPGLGNLPMDVYEKPDAFYIRAATPGATEEDIDLSIEKDIVTLRGTIRCDYGGDDTKVYLLETPYGNFTRSVRLPENCQGEQAEARFDRGVLTVRIPKSDKPSDVRSIPIRQSVSQPATPGIEANATPENGKGRSPVVAAKGA